MTSNSNPIARTNHAQNYIMQTELMHCENTVKKVVTQTLSVNAKMRLRTELG